MNIFHYFLPIFRLHRNMQVCLTCMYGRDTCFLAGKVGGIRLRVWDSWDSLERWWQKYGHCHIQPPKNYFFSEKLLGFYFDLIAIIWAIKSLVMFRGLPACEYCHCLLTQQAPLYWEIQPPPTQTTSPLLHPEFS